MEPEMELFLSDHKINKIASNSSYVFLWIIAITILLIIFTYPYKKITSGNVVIDLEVNLQNKDFNSIIKTTQSNYFVLSEPRGLLSMTPQNIWVYFIAMSKYFFLFVAGFIVLFNARKILDKIREGKAFDTDNSKILNLLAVVFVIMPFIFALRTYLLNQYISDDLIINGFKVIKPDPLSAPFAAGIISAALLKALAKLLRQGRKLKEENDLTV
jgi:hypothetical protein